MFAFLNTSSRTSGILKQPSLKAHSSPDSSRISGFIKVCLNLSKARFDRFRESSSSAKGDASIQKHTYWQTYLWCC